MLSRWAVCGNGICVCGTHSSPHAFPSCALTILFVCGCVCVHREQGQRSEESSPSLAASLRHQTLKQSPSQHSFDSAILDGSLPDENLSVDSDVSDNLFVLMDSGIQ